MIHEALRLIRVFHDLNQSQLAAKLNISKSYLSEIESGKKEPTLQLLQRYADVLKMPLSSLVFFAEELQRSPQKSKARQKVSKKVLAIMRFIAARSGRSDIDD
jgi:transcriptional regulator with XRE-family HTH domain